MSPRLLTTMLHSMATRVNTGVLCMCAWHVKGAKQFLDTMYISMPIFIGLFYCFM